MTLFAKEFKSAVCSVLYLVFVGAMAAFYITQFGAGVAYDAERYRAGEPGVLTVPQPGQPSYGTVYTENPERVMPAAVHKLVEEYTYNSYQTYPFMFVRNVRLNETQQAEVAAAIEHITGQRVAEVYANYERLREENLVYIEDVGYMANPDSDVTGEYTLAVGYEEFKARLAAVDKLLGGGSRYAEDNLRKFSEEPMAYEQALADYNDLIYEDKVTGGFARLFCDYMGISLALFSIFVPVGFLLRDGRAKAQQLVYSRRVSSFKLVVTRYFACLAAVFLPVLALATVAMVQVIPLAASAGLATAPFAFYSYSFTWLLPTAMVCCSVGFLFTVLTGTPVGIAVQLLWSFLALNGRELQSGDFKGALLLRFNTERSRAIVVEKMDLLVRNRVGYTCLALVILAVAVLLYSLQRKGRLDVSGWFRRRFGRRAKAAAANSAA